MESSGLVVTWNITYLLLAVAVSFAGAHITVSLADQYRISCTIKPKLLGKKLLLFLMAVSSGGVGAWTVHFVGMGALVLKDADDHPVHRKFDRVLIGFSLFSAVGIMYAALLIASMDTLHTKSRDDIYKVVLEDSVPGSANAVRSKAMLIRRTLTTRLVYLVVGGIIGSVGICASHYIGFQALIWPVNTTLDTGITAASTVIAVVGSTFSFWLLFRVLALYPEYVKFRFAYIAAAMATTCGMLFTGVAATSFTLREDGNHSRQPLGITLDTDVAVQNVLAAGLIFCFVANALILAEKRLWIRDFMTANRRVTKMMERLSQDPKYQNEAFVSEYFTSTAHIREDVGSSIKLNPDTLFRASSRSDHGTAKVSPGTSDISESSGNTPVKSGRFFDEVEEFSSEV